MPAALLLPLLALTSLTTDTRASPREEVVSNAAALVGARGAKDAPSSAAGLVLDVYSRAGVPLLPRKAQGSADVAALWSEVASRGALKHRAPRPGDLVFFRDTEDRDRDGRLDDGITHVGVVERVAEDGTVVFIHRTPRGATRARLHPDQPTRRFDPKGGRVLNDRLREARGKQRAALTGELLAGYGAASVLTGAVPRYGVRAASVMAPVQRARARPQVAYPNPLTASPVPAKRAQASSSSRPRVRAAKQDVRRAAAPAKRKVAKARPSTQRTARAQSVAAVERPHSQGLRHPKERKASAPQSTRARKQRKH